MFYLQVKLVIRTNNPVHILSELLNCSLGVLLGNSCSSMEKFSFALSELDKTRFMLLWFYPFTILVRSINFQLFSLLKVHLQSLGYVSLC